MIRRIVPIALAAGLLGGCTDDSVPTVDTNVDKDQPVVELDEPTEQELCDDLETFAREFYNSDLNARIACISVATLAGVNLETGELDAGACNRAYDECLDNPPDDVEPIDPNAEYQCDVADIPAECSDLTVGDLVECTEEAAQLIDEYIVNFSCDKLTEASSMTEVGAACQRLESKCPSLFEEPDPGTDPPPE